MLLHLLSDNMKESFRKMIQFHLHKRKLIFTISSIKKKIKSKIYLCNLPMHYLFSLMFIIIELVER